MTKSQKLHAIKELKHFINAHIFKQSMNETRFGRDFISLAASDEGRKAKDSGTHLPHYFASFIEKELEKTSDLTELTDLIKCVTTFRASSLQTKEVLLEEVPESDREHFKEYYQKTEIKPLEALELKILNKIK